MSEADKMLEELGYRKIEDEIISYIKGQRDIVLEFRGKELHVLQYSIRGLSMQELKAINKKCLELRMDRGVINNVNRKRNRCHRLDSGNGNVGCVISYNNDS